LGLPTPLLTGCRIVDGTGPSVCNLLPIIRGIRDLEIGDMLPDLQRKFSGRETTPCDVKVRVMLEPRDVVIHDIQCRLEAVRHVHHGEDHSLLHETGITTVLYSFKEDLHCVIRGSSARRSVVADDSGKSNAPDVQTIYVEILVPQELSG